MVYNSLPDNFCEFKFLKTAGTGEVFTNEIIPFVIENGFHEAVRVVLFE
jgi:hypothetical protein